MTKADDAKDIATKSGNNFHSRVTNELRRNGWSILVSPYYMDAAGNKPRELDLVAEKHWVRSSSTSSKNEALLVRLFVECKYITDTTVFWFSAQDRVSTLRWLVTNTPLRENNIYTEKHHYLAGDGKVAKLFASKGTQGTESEPIYRALNQSLNALVYLRGRQSIIPDVREGRVTMLATVELPVVVCNNFDSFFAVEMENPGTPEALSEGFLLEVDYAYVDASGARQNDYFLLDVVDFSKLNKLFSALEADKDTIFEIL